VFEKERQLLSTSWNFDFANFETAIEQRKKFESTLGNVQDKMAEALKLAKDCRARINAPTGVVEICNEKSVMALYSDIADWQSLYEVLSTMAKNSPKAFEEREVALGMKELSTYVDQFQKYMKTQQEFNNVADFVKRINACGTLSEKTVDSFCREIQYHENLLQSSYLPDEIDMIIKEALAVRQTVDKLNELYGTLEEHLDFIEERTRFYDSAAIKSIAGDFKKYESYLQWAYDQIEFLENFQEELRGSWVEKAPELFLVYKKEHAPRIKKALSLLNERLASLRAVHAAIEGRISARGIIAKILGIIMFSMMGITAILTVANTILSFGESISWFWAILFGLIVGALYTVIRVAAMYGLGALWWPSAFATLFFGHSSFRVNKAVLIFNIAFLIVSFLYTELTIYREDRDLRNGSSSTIRSFAMAVPFIGSCALILGVLWSGISGLVRIWSTWSVFEVFCGFFFGLFRIIMMIVGAGFWWPSLYSVTGENGMILNAAFYILVVIFIVYAARQKD